METLTPEIGELLMEASKYGRLLEAPTKDRKEMVNGLKLKTAKPARVGSPILLVSSRSTTGHIPVPD